MSEGFREDAVAVASPVREWHSLASTSSKYGEAEAVTVLSDTFVVTLYAFARDESGLREATQVIASLAIHDR